MWIEEGKRNKQFFWEICKKKEYALKEKKRLTIKIEKKFDKRIK
jgi:hypothetical protein